MLIGIDAGGTSTRAVVLDETGRCLGFGVGGGGNPVALGPAQAGQGIHDAVERAISTARAAGYDDVVGQGGASNVGGGSTGARNSMSVLAMAGASSFAAPGVMANMVREVSGVAHVQVMSDLLAMFASGTPEQRGYVLVSGTGAAALRIKNDMVEAAADGLGWLLGDAGSGFWIGHRAVRAALGALSGHAPETTMTVLLQKSLGVALDQPRTTQGRFVAVETAIDTFYQMPPIELAKYASMAFTAAKVADPQFDGEPVAPQFPADADPVAVRILTDATEQLVRTLAAVRIPELPGPIVLGGTVAKRLPGLTAAVRTSVAGAGRAPSPAAPSDPQLQVRIVPDGAVGAAVLTLRQAGITVDQEIFDRVTSSLAALR
ncbi:MAG: BadF/BadG/BcrA/BcrD ATPase family protein [Nakamurella sp.]